MAGLPDFFISKIPFCIGPQCSHVLSIENYAAGATLDEALAHMSSWSHVRKECRYGHDCQWSKRYRRHQGLDASPHEEGEETKDFRIARGHCSVYFHPFSKAWYEGGERFLTIPAPPNWHRIPSASRNLESLIHEVVNNGFESVFTCPDGRSLRDIAAEKMDHPIHVMIGTPLRQCHIMAVLLYTGTDCQTDLHQCHRMGNFRKWPVFRAMLNTAIRILQPSEAQVPQNSIPDFVYAGFHSVSPMAESEFEYCDFLSTAARRAVAETRRFLGSQGTLFKIRRGNAISADVSWISKFPHEEEILFSPLYVTKESQEHGSYLDFDGNRFTCTVLTCSVRSL
ncbi:unnamed protein product [Polarella glacialis]|uniref:NAD(P)(+)--arginine ADP-ribosyltransferase n=1 Tax=Polarella glacialis TaxID=89957 RepID=A0A813KTX8_POLGL|nr:unnamed protein product [Polarella glacialis]